MIRWCCLDHGLKLRVDRDAEDRPRLLLPHVDGTISNVLSPHLDRVAAPLPGVEQQGEGQPGTCADGMPVLEGGNVGSSPAPPAIGAQLGPLHADARVVCPHP
jgi:hypothetical protein